MVDYCRPTSKSVYWLIYLLQKVSVKVKLVFPSNNANDITYLTVQTHNNYKMNLLLNST